MLGDLISRIRSTQLQGKDNEAEQYIQQNLGSNPDALYVLCQTVLVQQYALDQAQRRLEEARQQQQQAAPGTERHTSFLGRIFGGDDAGQPPAPQPPAPQPRAPQAPPAQAPIAQAPPAQGSGYAPVPYPGQAAPPYPPPGAVYGQPQYIPAGPFGGGFGGGGFGGGGFGGGGFGGGGFLQGALQTAAGVAAGELAFRGIEDLMHGFGHAAGYGSDRALGGFDEGRSFGDTDRADGGSFGDQLQADHPGNELSPDIEDRRGEGGRGFFGDGGGGGDAFTSDGSDDTGDNISDDSGDDSGDAGGFDDGGTDVGGDDGGGNDDSF